jgi:hypothetical protein
MDADRPCTLATLRARSGQEAELLQVMTELGELLAGLPARPGGSTLVQSLDDPLVFHSSVWWHRIEDLEAMRADPAVRERLERMVGLCSEFTSGAYRVVVTDGDPAPPGRPDTA